MMARLCSKGEFIGSMRSDADLRSILLASSMLSRSHPAWWSLIEPSCGLLGPSGIDRQSRLAV